MAKSQTMEKPITSFGFDASKGVDQKVLSLVNTYSSLFPGIPTLSLLRNLLLETLQEKIERIRAEQQAKTA